MVSDGEEAVATKRSATRAEEEVAEDRRMQHPNSWPRLLLAVRGLINKNRLFYLLGHLSAVHDRMLPLLGIGERLHPELDEAYLTNPDQTISGPLAAADLLNRNDGRRPENKPRTWQSNDILFNLSPISNIQRN
jgi:hypothetical protein